MDEIRQNLKEFIMKIAKIWLMRISNTFRCDFRKGMELCIAPPFHQPVEVKGFRTCWTTSKEDLLCRGTPWWLVESDAENNS